MRFIVLLIFALLLTIALVVFPNIADQALRFEAFGWVFETRQGAFIAALLGLLFVIWLIRALASALFAGPGHLWRSLRMGSRRRREQNLREALAQWLDARGDMGVKTLKRSRGVLPDWTLAMLKALMLPAKDQPQPTSEQDPLLTALSARIVTGPTAHPRPDLATRKTHLKAWLNARPGSPLAMSRLADLAEEEQDWPKLVELLEGIWKKGHRSSHAVKPRLVKAYLAMSQLDPESGMQYLRKAHRLMPDNREVLLAYGLKLVESGDTSAAIRLWQTHLESEGDLPLARQLLLQLQGDPLRTYRKLEGKSDAELNEAQRWLRAELAHCAKLDGLAFEQMQSLAEGSNETETIAAAWQSLGNWYLDNHEHGQAAKCYREALETFSGEGLKLDKAETTGY